MTKTGRAKPNVCFFAGAALAAVPALLFLPDVLEGVAESGCTWQTGCYGLLVLAALLICLLSAVLFFYKKPRLELCFLSIALCLGLLYLFVLPPLSAPDEIRHYISAYSLSDEILGVPANVSGHVPVRAEDWFAEDSRGDYIAELSEDGFVTAPARINGEAVPLGQVLTSETYEKIYESVTGGGPASEAENLGDLALSYHLPVNTTPVVYLLPALGITLARLLNLSTVWLLIFGRLANLLLYLFVTACAIRRLPFGKGVLFGVAILPMSLHLAASFSYDTALLCGFWLFAAVCLDLAYDCEKVRARDVALLAFIMALVGPCKMVYALLMGLCLLIPVKKFGGWGKWLLAAVAVTGAWALAMLFVNSQTVAAYATGTENYIDWAGEAGYTFSMVLHSPLHALRLAAATVLRQAGEWVSLMIGANLGNSDPVLEVPFLLILGFGVGLLLLALKKPGETTAFSAGNRVLIWCVCFLTVGALLFSMLLAWTPLSSPIINGVQGRYFLPFLPVLLLSFQNDTIVLTKDADRSILYLMCCANSAVLMRIFSTVSMRL